MSQEQHTEHPLYRELYAYADQFFELLDEHCAVDSAWPNGLDLDEMERHLLDTISQFGIALDLAGDDHKSPKLIELLGQAYNNFRIVQHLLRNILLSDIFARDDQFLRSALNNFLKRGAPLENALFKVLNEVGVNLKLI